MRFTSNRHLFALLALTQSLLVLLGVMYLFTWFESTEMATIRQQSTDDTQAVASGICIELEASSRSSDSEPQDVNQLGYRFRKAASRLPQIRERFACLLNSIDGDILYQQNLPNEMVNFSLGSLPFFPNLNPEKATSLAQYFAKNPDIDTVSGLFPLDGQYWIGSAKQVRGEDAIVIVLQNESTRMYQRAKTFNHKRTRTLFWAFLLSLIAIAAPILALHYHDDKLRATNNNLERQATQNERELMRTRNAVIFGLAKLAESRDNDTGEHLDRIRKYVEILSDDLSEHIPDVNAEFTKNISLASSLHDIGKVGIPDSILLKPGRLTAEERSVMQFHTVIGGECLDAIHARLGSNPFMHMAREIAYYHHERWDGNGYPHQLKEYDIPLVARIVAVADVYDALTSKRPYKRAMSHLESRAIVLSGSGTQFDPEVVAAFMRHEHEFESISLSQQSLSSDQLTSPFVKLHEMTKSTNSIEENAPHAPA